MLVKQLRAQFASLIAFIDAHYPARVVAKHFKEELKHRMWGLTKAIGAKQPDVLADQLSLVIDGAYASGQAVGSQGPCLQVESMVDALINAQLHGKR